MPKSSCCISHRHGKKGIIEPGRSPPVLETIPSIARNASSVHRFGYVEGCQLGVGTCAGKGSATGLGCSRAQVLGLVEPSDSVVLEVSVLGEGMVWSF